MGTSDDRFYQPYVSDSFFTILSLKYAVDNYLVICYQFLVQRSHFSVLQFLLIWLSMYVTERVELQVKVLELSN